MLRVTMKDCHFTINDNFSAFVLPIFDCCNSLLVCSTGDVISHFQQIQNYAVQVILHIPMSANIITHL